MEEEVGCAISKNNNDGPRPMPFELNCRTTSSSFALDCFGVGGGKARTREGRKREIDLTAALTQHVPSKGVPSDAATNQPINQPTNQPTEQQQLQHRNDAKQSKEQKRTDSLKSAQSFLFFMFKIAGEGGCQARPHAQEAWGALLFPKSPTYPRAGKHTREDSPPP